MVRVYIRFVTVNVFFAKNRYKEAMKKLFNTLILKIILLFTVIIKKVKIIFYLFKARQEYKNFGYQFETKTAEY